MDPNFSSLPEVTRDVTKSNSELTLAAQRALYQCFVKCRRPENGVMEANPPQVHRHETAR